MAENFLRNWQGFVLCTECQSKNVVFDPNKPPKFCSECGGRLPPPINNAIHNTKATDESVKKLEKFPSENKPAIDLSLENKPLNVKPCSAKPPDNKPCNTKSSSEKSSKLSDKPPGNKLNDKAHSDKLGDKPSGGKLGDKSHGDKLGDKPPGSKLGDKPHGDKLGDKPPGGKLGDKLPGGKLGDKPPGDKLGDKLGDKPHGDKPHGDKLGDKPPGGKLGDKPHSDKLGDKPPAGKLGDKPHSDKLGDKPPGDKPPGGKLGDKPHGGKLGDKPPGGKLGDKPHGDKQHGDKPHGDKLGDKPHGDKLGDKPHGDKLGDKPHSDKLGDKPPGDKLAIGDKPRDKLHGDKLGDKPHGDKLGDKPPGDKLDNPLGDKLHGDKLGDKPHGDKPGDKPHGDKLGDKPPGGKLDDKSHDDKLGNKPPGGKLDDKSHDDKLGNKPPGGKLDDKSHDDKLGNKPPGGKLDDKSHDDKLGKPPGGKLDDKSHDDKLGNKPNGDKLDDKSHDDKLGNKPNGDKLDDKSHNDGNKPNGDKLGDKPPDNKPNVKPPRDKSDDANNAKAKQGPEKSRILPGEADNRTGIEVLKKKSDDDENTKQKKMKKDHGTMPKKGTVNFDPPKFTEPATSIEFHVLLSKGEWLWDNTANVYIRFGDYRLGGFDCCHGPMQIHKEYAEYDVMYTELVYTVSVPVSIFNYPYCPYKYCVLSKPVEELMKSPYEFIAGHDWSRTAKIINRLLRFSDSFYIMKERVYVKFDGLMHPQFDHDKLKQLQSKEGSKHSLWSSLTGIISKIKNYIIPSSEDETKHSPALALRIYLSEHHKILTGIVYTSKSPIEIDNNPRLLPNSHDVQKEMSSWLQDVIEELQSYDGKFNILQSVIILIMVICRLELDKLEDKHYQVLFKGLCTIPEFTDTDGWPDLMPIKESFLKNDKLKSELVIFMKQIQRKSHWFKKPIVEVIFSFPMLHFAQGLWKPFQPIMDFVNFESSKKAALNHFKDVTAKCFPLPEKFLDDNPCLFAADPFLLLLCVLTSPIEEYSKLINKVPLFMLLTAMIEKVNFRNAQKELDIMQLFIKAASKLEYTSDSRTELLIAVKSALQLVVKGREKYSDLNDHLYSMVELFLVLREKCFVAHDEKMTALMHKEWNLYAFIQELIQALLPQKSFGGSRKQFTKEIMIWTTLNEIDCPKSFEIEWHNFMEEIIKQRISELESNLMNLLLTINPDTTPEFITEIILTYVAKNFDNIKDMDLEDPSWLQRMVSSPTRYGHRVSNRILDILSSILNKRYPKAEDITEKELLEWKMWPSFFGMIVKNVKLEEDDHYAAVVAALSQLHALCESICSRSITLRSLSNIRNKEAQFKKLCDTVSLGNQDMCMTFSQVKPHLDECFYLQSQFEDYRNQISTLLEFCSGISYGSLTKKLLQELNKDYYGIPVKELFVPLTDSSSSQVVCKFFSTENVPAELLRYLYIVGKKYHNDIFETCWRKQCKLCANLHTFQAVFDMVCTPVFTECKEILVSLEQRTMTLENVEMYFGRFDSIELKNNLQSLCGGMKECFPSEKQLLSPINWISTVAKSIQEYKKISSYITAAKIVLLLKDSMKLTGDFTAVNTIVQQMKPDFKKQTLSVINRELLTAGEALTEISSSPLRCHCLKVFSSSTELIDWLRSETGSVGAVANFVEVATSTTGEGDYHLGRLSLLHSVATGYSSLIFDVDHNIGFIELCNKCQSLWKALEENPQLPEYLIKCEEDLDLYVEIKKIQGSVEVTSINQVEDINLYGAYTIHCDEQKNFQLIENTVSLKISRVKAAKKDYSFNDLRDLESKLALIRGRSTKGGAEMDRFLNVFHLVCRIAGTLQQLQHAGHTKYISWSLTFTCSTVSIDTLTSQATSMEKELSDTLDLIKEQRRNFHALNYFTTQQLLQIRCELGSLRQNKAAEVTPRLLSLLTNFSLQITADDIKDIVDEICTLFSEQEAIARREENGESEEQSLAIPKDKMVEGSYEENQKENQLVGEDEDVEMECKNLSELIQDLTDDEEEIFVQLLNLGYSKAVCYNAVQHAFSSTESTNHDDILDAAMDWCFDNANQYAKNDEVNDSEETIPDQHGPSEAEETAMEEESISIGHPVVQELLKLGFTPELSLKGVKLCNGDFEQASEWCLNAETENSEIEQPLFATFEGNVSFLSSQGYEEAVDPISSEWEESWDKESVYKYMDILETAAVLEEIHDKFAGLPSARSFPQKILHVGEPNLLIVTPGDLLRTVLSLYMKDPTLPLPSSAEVCICTSTTTAEEVELLWHRAMKDPDYQNIYCLVHAERLSYQVCEAAFKEYDSLSQGNNRYRVVIICSLEDEERAHVVSKLHQYRREYPPLPSNTEIAAYLNKHFISLIHECAAMVDPEMSTVRVVASDVSGMGKSLYIERLAEKLEKQCQIKCQHVIIPIHGPVVNADTVMVSLCNHGIGKTPIAQIIHFDIASSVLSDVDTLLFSLLILKSLTDSRGQIWHCLPLQYYVIEVTYTDIKSKMVHQNVLSSVTSLLEVLPTVKCVSPLEALKKCSLREKKKTVILMDEEIFRSTALQRVYQYLRSKNSTSIKYIPGSIVEESVPEVLNLLLKHCGVRNPSWAELYNFVKFLNIQLYDCEESVYCNEAIPVVRDVLQGFKQFVVKFMIRMSRDFATPSLKAAVLQAENEDINDTQQDVTEQYQIIERKAWETSFHPYIFFNYDRASMTFLGFKITPNGDLVDPETNRVIEHQLLSKELRKGLTDQKVNFDENYFAWDRFNMIRKLCTMMGFDMSDPDDTYVLTIDNMKKMLAIQMRFRCNIPVVIMGETGCGKTRLIRYMCDLQTWGSGGYKTMLMMKVHGGITEQDIEKKVNEAIELAKQNKAADPPVDTVLFFDEANTTEAIGLIKEIMCDRRLNGEPLPEDIKFIAACNPYRKHSKEMIQRLEKAGLGFYVQSTKTIHRLGSVPLRQLVYRVLALPPSMQPLVYDFGQLTNTTEKDYTTQIVTDRIKKNNKFNLYPNCDQIKRSVSHVFAACQVYMRKREDECSFVSLRDVERAMIVFEWFYDKNTIIETELKQLENYKPLDPVVRSLIMAVAVCYHARLQERNQFEEVIIKTFEPPYHIPGGRKQFVEEIFMCQSMFLRQMKLGPNIASNAALRENVFMMVVCIELRIPLFLVGKPGSSKSLAKSIVADSMQGRTSHSLFLKELKQVKMFSYQCSQLSTPQSVLEVFSTADKFQKSKEKDTKDTSSRFVSVVVLDEVGLAEDSPSLPLKALHPLLEDGTSGADSQIIDREKRVAFVGISNWALDPAKMNRGVMVTRGKPDEEELILSARGICSMEKDDKYRDRLEKYFKLLAMSYLEICEKQQPKEFFGLRDFYSLIKMLYWMIKKTNQPLTMRQLEHAVRRNFGGLDEVDAVGIFQKNIHIADVNVHNPKIIKNMYPDCSAMGLIKTSLATKETSVHGESRYLLFLTENYAALSILQQDLLFHAENPPFVLFGSSFPKDREYTQVCRNINQIKICMETGRSVILLNLENLYESLYDVLNQYYTRLPGKRYVDLGLQTHRIKCRVHDDFKLILIAERDKVYEEFPTPLINRLEKHFVVTATVLNDTQKQLLTELENWVKKYTSIRNFKVGDAFVGYQKDTPAAVVFQVSHVLKDQVDIEDVEHWKAKALVLSKRLLLETASPDSLVRLTDLDNSQIMDECVKIYFEDQNHASLCDLLQAKLFDSCGPSEGFLLHITTHGHLLSRADVNVLYRSLRLKPDQVICFLLQEFDTEMDFSLKLKPIFRRQSGKDCLLIIQCDAGHLNIDLIACARHRIIDERVSALQMNTDTDQYVPLQATHVVFIVQLPKQAGGTKFVGFQGAQWDSVHIDDLNPPKDLSFDLPNAFCHSMSEIFGIPPAGDSDPEVFTQFGASRRLHNLIQKAASRLYDTEKNRRRTTERIELLLNLIPPDDSSDNGEKKFHHILVEHISSILQERDAIVTDSKNWVFLESVESKKLRQGGTFRNCLSKKFDEVIVPMFAEILGTIDKNYNLSLIHNAPDQSTLIAKLWLGIFANKQICTFSYNDVALKNQQQQQQNYRIRVPGIGALLASPDYRCTFPFSWVVKDTIDSQWDNATALVAQTKNAVSLDAQLYDLATATPLGEFINSEIFTSHPEECLSLYQSYLNDFVSSVYQTTRDDEIKLVCQALDSDAQKIAPDDADLLRKLVSVHIAYDTVKAHIQQFHQLVSLEPGITEVLAATVPYPANEMNLAYFAVQEMLATLTPNFEHWDQYTIQNWIRRLHKVCSAIEAVLNFDTEPGSDAEELKTTNRYKWQRMCVIKMFAEHISLNFTENEIIISAKRLWTFLAKPNFQSKATLQKVKKVMDSLDQSVRQTWKVQDPTQSECIEASTQSQLHEKFRLKCRSFFMEVLSTLCFERNMPNPPEHDLIMMLMDIVFAEGKSTRLLSPFNNEKADPAPVIRSYLLQLLLTFSSTEVRALLKEYFERSHNLVHQDQELYVLCVQCFEDAIHIQSSDNMSIEDKFRCALEMVINNYDLYQNLTGAHVVTLEYLEGVASLRYGLSMTATVISECYHSDTCYDLLQQEDLNQLFNFVESLCLNSYYTQPHEFITKFIVRQFGMQFLKKLVEHPAFEWLIPPHLKPKKKKNTTIDPFVLYDKNYKDVREAVALSLCGSDVTELQTVLKELTLDNSLVFPLTLYQQVTVQAKEITDKAKECLTTLTQSCSILSNEMRYITALLLHNKKQGYHLAKLRVDQRSPHYWCLRDIVIHCAVVFTHKQHEHFLQPFMKLMYNPATMKGDYFPTMPDDPLFHAMNILTGRYYTCPRGHPYHIGDCGRAVMRAVCPECGSAIGGTSHALDAGNQPVQMGDRTQTGHVLGSPDKRSMLPEPERSLSPSGCALLRLLLHSVLVWSSCNADDYYLAELADLVHPNVPGDYLAQFFWEHLQRDMEVLSKSLNLNKDDAALIVHSILRHISQLQRYPACDANLVSKPSRKKWEEEFHQVCAQPILQDVQKHHQHALDLITNDDSQEHDILFFTIYEKIPVHAGDIQPAMWRYRARITLEHLTHALQQSTGKSLALLKEFLRLEPVLRITQYLPDILYLQKLLFDQFHQRLDQGIVLNMTVDDYLESLNNDHLRQVIPKLVQKYNKAWMIAKQHLVNNGRFNVPEEYVAATPVIGNNTNVVYLIPTTTREGICSTMLLDFLVTTHNEFINYYHKHYPLAEKYCDNELMKNSIPLSQLQECHLLNYESHIISVVLSHCHHSLEVGKGTDIQYDLQALEKKIVDKFIHGKPLIQFENAPRVVYRKDIHNVKMFMDVRAKVPQENITVERRKIILAELQSPQRLSEALDVIDIVLGFLSSGTGSPSMPFGDYVKKTLKMHVTRRTLPKAIQDCTLANTLSLWEMLSVEQAKQLTLINQEPFDKVDDLFKEVLDKKTFEQLHLSLKRFPLDYLLTILHEFIITHVSHSNQEQAKWPLKDTLFGFLERQGLPEFKELEHLPDDVLMCHVASTWKEIVLHQSKLEK